jgi:hypothetical protein
MRRFILLSLHIMPFDLGFNKISHTASVKAQCSSDKVGTAVVEKADLAITATQKAPLSFCSKRER